MSSRLYVVTAGIEPERTREFWSTWAPLCTLDTKIIYMVNSDSGAALPAAEPRMVWAGARKVLGPVKAFQVGISVALSEGASLIACLHDDVALLDSGWDERIVQHFDRRAACTLVGFSGAEGLGAPGIYQEPKELHQLARQGFFSNMVDAEKHGTRVLGARKSACADGFSQIGRAAFLKRAFTYILSKGVQHHFYDSWLGMLAWRWGGECWYLPERCAHAGGRTAVLAPEYHAFAEKLGGDAGLWQAAHEAGYEDGRGFLPYRVDP